MTISIMLGKLAVADVKEGTVRRWRTSRLDSGVGVVTVAKACRLLKAIMNTAVDDGMIKRNPCRIDGAGQEHSPERPVLTATQVFALANAFDRRYRLPIQLAVFCSLRWVNSPRRAAPQRHRPGARHRLGSRQRGRAGARAAGHRGA
jgi:hypothetical protein